MLFRDIKQPVRVADIYYDEGTNELTFQDADGVWWVGKVAKRELREDGKHHSYLLKDPLDRWKVE